MAEDDELQFFLDEESSFLPLVPDQNVHRLGAMDPVGQQLSQNMKNRSYSGDSLNSFGSSSSSRSGIVVVGSFSDGDNEIPVKAVFDRNFSGRTNPIVVKESNKRRRSTYQDEQLYDQSYSQKSPQRMKSIKVGTSPNRRGYGTPPRVIQYGGDQISLSPNSFTRDSAATVELWKYKNPKLVLESYNCVSPGTNGGVSASSSPSRHSVGSIDREFLDFYQEENGGRTLDRSDTVPFGIQDSRCDKTLTVHPRPQQLERNFQSRQISCEPLQRKITEMEIQ